MAVSRHLDIQIKEDVLTKEVTLKGEDGIYTLITKLINLGIINDLGLKQTADNFACLIRLREARVKAPPLLLRFIGHYFNSKQAYDFMQFFCKLSELGINLEIIDNKLAEANPAIFEDYFFKPIQSKIKLVGYTIDLDKQILSLFSQSVGLKSLHKWAGELNIIYSVETMGQFIAMLEALNMNYVSAVLERKSTFSCITPDRYTEELDDGAIISHRLADQLPAEYTSSLTISAEFLLGLRAVCYAYLKLGRDNGMEIKECYDSVKQIAACEKLDDVLMNVFIRLETLLALSTLPFFVSPLHTRIEKLNDNFGKSHAARMLSLLLQACAEHVDHAERKAALLNLHYPVNVSAELAAAYDEIRQPLARLKSVMQAHHRMHLQEQSPCHCKS